jgi:antitoxin component YwqK of YwqJK toxin-antitoxin module
MDLRIKAICIYLLLTLPGLSQPVKDLNQTDRNGRKQGRWIRYYPNGNVMYNGIFKDDKPTGEFNRYYEDNGLKSLLIFSQNGTEATATLYYPNGLIASRGKYINQLKEGKWQFFSSTSEGLLISEEEYAGDKRNGYSVNYYPDSTVAEKLFYRNDLKDGEWVKYYPDGTIIFKAYCRNGKLDGSFEAFFENGITEFIGLYKNDLREGLWIIYDKNGKERFKTIYNAGIPDNRDIDIYQSEYLDSLERNKVKIADPEKTGEIW